MANSSYEDGILALLLVTPKYIGLYRSIQGDF